MILQRITNPSGIDDIKLIGQTDAERDFIRQLAEAGTLISTSSTASSSIIFRPVSIDPTALVNSTLISKGKIGQLDITIRQNQNYTLGLAFKDAAVPKDLSVYKTIKLQVKSSKSSGAIVELSLYSGLTVSGVDNNVLSIAFVPAQTSLLCNDEYYYDILMSNGISNSYFIEGKIKINRTATS